MKPYSPYLCRVEDIREKEVEQGPELMEVVLQWGACQEEAIGRTELTDNLRQLGEEEGRGQFDHGRWNTFDVDILLIPPPSSLLSSELWGTLTSPHIYTPLILWDHVRMSIFSITYNYISPLGLLCSCCFPPVVLKAQNVSQSEVS